MVGVLARGWTVTAVIPVGEVAGTGAGTRLRGIGVRLLLVATFAGAAWLLGAVLTTGTASAAESQPTDTAGGLLNVVGSVTDTVTGTVTNTLADIVPSTVTGNVVHTVSTTVDTTVGTATNTVTRPVRKTVTPTPATTMPAVVHRSAARTSTSTPERSTTARPADHHPTAVHPTRTTTKTARPVARYVVHHSAAHPRRTPRHTPAGPAPQPLSPVLPTGSLTSAHDTGGIGRNALLPAAIGPTTLTRISATGWTADPAVLAARSQGLPATSPD
jgi:hypothetical protein